MVGTRTRAPKVARIATLVVRRTAVPLVLLLTVFVVGTAGYYLIGVTYDRGWTLADCAFMTSITLSTVGYGDVLDVQNFPLARAYTMILIVTGLGTTLYRGRSGPSRGDRCVSQGSASIEVSFGFRELDWSVHSKRPVVSAALPLPSLQLVEYPADPREARVRVLNVGL